MPIIDFFKNRRENKKLDKRIKVIKKMMEVSNQYGNIGNRRENEELRMKLNNELERCETLKKSPSKDSKLAGIPRDNSDVREATMAVLDKSILSSMDYIPDFMVKDLNEAAGKERYNNDLSYIKNKASARRGKTIIRNETESSFMSGKSINDISMMNQNNGNYDIPRNETKKITRRNAVSAKEAQLKNYNRPRTARKA